MLDGPLHTVAATGDLDRQKDLDSPPRVVAEHLVDERDEAAIVLDHALVERGATQIANTAAP